MTDTHIGKPRVAPDSVPDGLTLAAFNTDCSESALRVLGETLGAYLDIQNVTVGTTVTDDSQAEFAVLHDDVFVDGALAHPGRSDRVDEASTAYNATDTLFLTGYDDHSGLRMLSNRVETLAWRAGRGRLYAAGQQRLGAMDDQWDIYEGIADEGTEVHVFEGAELVPEDSDHFVVHGGHHSLAGTWLVAYDGDGNDAAKAVLLAVEQEPDSYYGVWTVVPELVDAILEHTVEFAAVEK